MCSRRCVIEGGEDARWAALLDEVAHNLVVEVLDRRPLDLFCSILLLFCFEGELDEDLLELLVDVVDAQLLEGVVLEDLEAEDVLQPREIQALHASVGMLTKIPMRCAVA